MNDTLEVDYTKILHNISEMVSDDYTYSGMIDGVPIRKLFISNLAERTTYKDLTNCFSVYGNVECCFLCRNRGKNNYAFVTFTKVVDAIRAMEDGNRKQIRLHNRDLRVMPADSWHQPDSIEQKCYNMGKESNKEKRAANEQYTQECLQNDIGKVSIHMLNNDCLTHIFLFLPIIDRVRIERVCKRWRDISQDSWHVMKTLDLSPSTWGFLDTHNIHTAMLRKILLKCGRFLTQINLSDPIHCLSQSTLTIIAKLCPNLTNIDITSLMTSASGINTLAHNCRNITKFNLGPSTYSCDNELKNLFKLNQNLEYFAISRNSISGKSLLCLPEQIMHTIILDRCSQIHDNHFSMALQRLKNLKHLTINDCIGIAERTLEVLGKHCKNLTVLELNGEFASVQTTDMLHLIHLVNLQVLKVTYNPKISDDFLANLVERCQQLVSLDITGCCNISDNGLNAIAALLKLEKLTISYIDDITDHGLINICGLKELECRKCVYFTDQGISMFIKSSPQLQLLDLSGCSNITEIILEVAKDACDTRPNNVMLKMIVGGTSIDPKQKIDEDKLSPLLQIVNVDLSVINIDTSGIGFIFPDNDFDWSNVYYLVHNRLEENYDSLSSSDSDY